MRSTTPGLECPMSLGVLAVDPLFVAGLVTTDALVQPLADRHVEPAVVAADPDVDALGLVRTQRERRLSRFDGLRHRLERDAMVIVELDRHRAERVLGVDRD